MVLVKQVFTNDELTALQYKYYNCHNIIAEIPKIQKRCDTKFSEKKELCKNCDIFKYCHAVMIENRINKWGY